MMVTSVTRMEVRSEVTEVILNITLEIIQLLTGKDCIIVKDKCGECVTSSSYPDISGGWRKTQRPYMEELPSQSVTHENSEKTNYEKILELANKIIELLSGEVHIRCQDISVHFSMEEWEYIEGHKDMYKDVIMENHQPLTSPGRLHDNASSHEQDSCFSCQLNNSSWSHLRNESKKAKKHLTKVSCDGRRLKYISNHVATSQAKYPFTHIMEEPISCTGRTLTDTNISTTADDSEQYPSTHIMEEPFSCNGGTLTDINISTNADDSEQYPSTHIMEELISCNGGTLTDTNIFSTTDDNEQYPTTHIMEEPVSCEEENLTDPDIYTPTDPTLHEPSPYIKGKPASCDGGTHIVINNYTPADDNEQYPSTHIMEEPVSCDEENLTDPDAPKDPTQHDPSPFIKEKPASCNGGALTDTNIHSSTDDNEHYPSTHIMERPVSCDEENLTDPNICTPTDPTQHDPSPYVKEKPASCDGDVTEPRSYVPTDRAQHYPASHIKEEPVSCDEDLTEPNSYTNTDHLQYPSPHIKEESISCDEDLTEPNSYTPTDHLQFPSPHIKEEPVSCDEDLTEPNNYIPTDHLQYPSPHIKEEPVSCDEDPKEPNSYIPMDHLQYPSHIKEEPMSGEGLNKCTLTKHSQEHQYAFIKMEPDSENGVNITSPNIYTHRYHAQYPTTDVKKEPVSCDGGNTHTDHAQQNPNTPIKEEPVPYDVSDFINANSYHTQFQSTHFKTEPVSCRGNTKFAQQNEVPITRRFGFLKETALSTDHTQNFPSTCVKDNISVQQSPALGHTDVKTEKSPSPVKVIVLAHLVDVDHTKPGSTSNKWDNFLSQECFASTSYRFKHDMKETRFPFRNRSSSVRKPEAGQTFGDISNLTKYSRTHSKKKTPQCLECGQYFLRKVQLDAHIRMHAKQKSLQCSDCGKYFLDNVQLLDLAKHNGETKYLCPVCRKCFDSKANHLSPEKEHKGEKPFQCPECGKCFSIYYELYSHKKTHTEQNNLKGDKPFQCHECGKCFSIYYELYIHKKTHMEDS